MKSIKVALMMAAVILLAAAGAQAQSAVKIGYVDLSRVFDGYNKTKEYDAVLEQKNTAYQQEREKMLNKVKDAQSKLSLLKETERGKLQTQMEKDRNDLLEFDRQQQTDLRKQRDEKIREILLEIEKVVKDYAQKEKYTLILNDRVLIYGDQVMNITDPILKALNDSYKGKK